MSLNKILHDYQYGFWTNHSTDMSFSLNDKILKGFDDHLLSGMILIKLQKAFDTINHDILLKKLNITGFSDRLLNGFNLTHQDNYGKFKEFIFRNFKHIMWSATKINTWPSIILDLH